MIIKLSLLSVVSVVAARIFWGAPPPDIFMFLAFVSSRGAQKKALQKDQSDKKYHFSPKGQMPKPLLIRIINYVFPILIKLRIIAPFKFSPEEVHRIAIKASGGLTDFDEQNFPYQKSLATLITSLKSEAKLTTWGTFWAKYDMINNLKQRLLIVDTIRKTPSICEEKINSPIFIIGVFRTGTTLLQNLMAEDPNLRAMKLYETVAPVIPEKIASVETSKSLTAIYWLSPTLRAAHYVESEGYDECHHMHRHQFLSMLDSDFYYNVPSYRKYYRLQDLKHVYRYQKRVMQLLQWKRRQCDEFKTPPRFILKCPDHLYGLDALLEEFPDAKFIWTHRDPIKVVSSMASLIGVMRSLNSNHVEIAHLSKPTLDLFAAMTKAGIAARRKAGGFDNSPADINAPQFIDVDFKKLMCNPIDILSRIYSSFNMTVSSELMTRWRDYSSRNPQHKHGKHVYGPKMFNYNTQDVAPYFAHYTEIFSDLGES